VIERLNEPDLRLLWRNGIALCGQVIGQRMVTVGLDWDPKGESRGPLPRVCNLTRGHNGQHTDYQGR